MHPRGFRSLLYLHFLPPLSYSRRGARGEVVFRPKIKARSSFLVRRFVVCESINSPFLP